MACCASSTAGGSFAGCSVSRKATWPSNLRAAGLYASPPALVRTTVYVQHLPGYVAGLSQVNNGVHNIFHATDRPHRRQRFQKIFRVIRVHWSVDNSGRHGIKTNMFLRVLVRQTTGDGLNAT